jgi:DNA-directed RNA polymerase subunit RPC12/RpoP
MNHGKIDLECSEVSNIFAGNEEVSCDRCGEIVLLGDLGNSTKEDNEIDGMLCPCCGEIILLQ